MTARASPPQYAAWGGWVLHVCPANGGGVDRFVRTICQLRPQDWLVHVAEHQCVLEHPASGQMMAWHWDTLKEALRLGWVARPNLLHVHSVVRHARDLVEVFRDQRVPWLMTLHDIGFEAADIAAEEVALRHQFVRDAAMCLVPSQYMADRVKAALGGQRACQVIENGAAPLVDQGEPLPPLAAGRFRVAVVGAIGEHKGWSVLKEIVQALPLEMTVVVLGYSADQMTPGWAMPGRLWVHGPFKTEQLPMWAEAYGVELVFFPPGQPESFCYALSDVWGCGLPVLVPDVGALGERVGRLGGGRLYDHCAPPEDVALCLMQAVSVRNELRAEVPDAMQLPGLADMHRQLDSSYAALAGAQPLPTVMALPSEPSPKPVMHLSAAFFRQELVGLAGRLADAIEQRDTALTELRQMAVVYDDSLKWQAHLAADIEKLQIETARLVVAHETQVNERAVLRSKLDESERSVSRVRRALRWLPSAWVSWLLGESKNEGVRR